MPVDRPMTETQGPAEARGPSTEAGRALYQLWVTEESDHIRVSTAILAIEAEARAAVRGTEGLDVTLPDADEAWEALRQVLLTETSAAAAFRGGVTDVPAVVARHRPLIAAAILRGVREAIEQELDGRDEVADDPFNAGAAAAYHFVLSKLAAIDGTGTDDRRQSPGLIDLSEGSNHAS